MVFYGNIAAGEYSHGKILKTLQRNSNQTVQFVIFTG